MSEKEKQSLFEKLLRQNCPHYSHYKLVPNPNWRVDGFPLLKVKS